MITVLHHADADGFGAAYAIHRAYTEKINYIPVQYGEDVPVIPGGTTDLWIVDFSYDRETCERLYQKYDLLVLDHHKTAEAALEGLDYAVFDQSKSGAVLAWEYFHFLTGGWKTEIPTILQYVQDRDLWKFELPYSKEVNLYIGSLPWEFEAWDKFDLGTAMEAGTAIKTFMDGQIKGALRDVVLRPFSKDHGVFDLGSGVADCEVPIVNCSANISEVGHALLEKYPESPFALMYCDRSDGMRSMSMRSRGDFDVAELAKKFGGGGHKAAAGYSLPATWG